MSEVEEKVLTKRKSKKLRLYQVAKEFHLSIEALEEFLRDQGYEVKSQMSPITEEMYQKISAEFRPEEPGAGTAEELEIQQRAHEREEKERERLNLIRKEIEELTEVKPPSLEEVQKKAEEEAEARRRREEQEKERLKKSKEDEKARKEALKAEEERRKAEAEKKKKEKEAKRIQRLLKIETSEPEAAVDKEPEAEEVPAAEAEVQAKAEAPTEEAVVETAQPAEVEEIVTETAPAEEVKETAPAEGEKKKKKKRKKAEAPEEAAGKKEAKSKKRKKKEKRKKVSEEEVQAAIRKTMAAMEEKGRPRKRRRVSKEEFAGEEEASNVIKVSEFISVAELARLMGVEPNEVIKKCMELGMLVSINQRLDMDTIVMVADEFGFEVEQEEMYGQDLIEELEAEEEDESQLVQRPPVVTIMGHVDHGKTSLLDYIRNSNIVAGEVGGITQHIGAYVVEVDGRKITFLDTPGHEAFTAMRARGAQVTDIVVLVVAADDRVMPQTVEAINHARAANVPIIVAINKIDKPNANPDLIKKQLSEHGVLVEDWGGNYPSVEVSAKTGQNVDQLLELIILQAELLELKANPNRLAKGVIIESQLDRGRGPVATVLVQNGTLKIGDPVIVGPVFGKVRAMFDERGNPVKEAGPSVPVQVLGFDEVPVSGDILYAVKSERIAREISSKRKQLKREHEFRRATHMTLDEFSKRMREKTVKELKLIVKADVQGSVEALSDALLKLSNEDVTVNVIHKGVGAVTETDVLLASASDAIIIGFQIRPNAKAWEVAAREKVDIRTYSIIYDAINDVKSALEGLLEPEEKEELLGIAEVRQVFRIPKVGNVAGCYVQSGRIHRNDKVRVVRDGKTVYE
ncbi:MAG TPA: translation initiation factor IF-2, partial [Bacteroidetes bacterium]|nr:translation initiation factor IF-2 [Bacteroidota bacterium]